MPHQPRFCDGVEVVPLCDAIGEMRGPLRRPLPEIFPGADPAELGEVWTLHFHCYLLRGPGDRLVLVDTGIGPVGSPASDWAPVPGALRDELSAVGVPPDEIDVVVLTHLHGDHIGGAVHKGEPAFRNARYVAQQAELEWIQQREPPAIDKIVRVIGDRWQPVAGTAELVPGVRVHHTPGHTPGHQIVEVGELTITGDLLLHPVQLARPEVRYRYDDDPEQAVTTRVDVLNRLRASGRTIATAHFTEPFTPTADASSSGARGAGQIPPG